MSNPWIIDEDDFYELETHEEQMQFLLRYAILAPSRHNTQPWSFHIGSDGVQVFADMSHHAHLVTNFGIVALGKDTADIKAYITGMGRSKAGVDILVYVRYDLKLRKTSQGWKISFFSEEPIMPMPDSVLAVHDKS